MISFIQLLTVYIGIYAILSLSLNLIVGYTGMLSLCHAAFFAIGSYATAILMLKIGMGFWLSTLCAGVISAVLGALIGLPTLRLKGDYLAIATLGFGEIVKNVILNWDSLTNGPMGINGVPIPKFFGFSLNPLVKWQYIILVWVFVAITYFILRRIIHSRLGRALAAIREDEIAAFAMGIDTFKYKVISFAIGAFFAGVAGSLWTVFNQSVTPMTYDFMLSMMILCMVVLGGLGNHFAALVGAAIIQVAGEFPRLLGFSSVIPAQFKQIIFGLILVFMMIFKPEGILGKEKAKPPKGVPAVREGGVQ